MEAKIDLACLNPANVLRPVEWKLDPGLSSSIIGDGNIFLLAEGRHPCPIDYFAVGSGVSYYEKKIDIL